MKTIRHVPKKVLAKAERTATSVYDLMQKLPTPVCEDYYFEISRSGANLKVKTVLKIKQMTITYFRYPKMMLKYAQKTIVAYIYRAPSAVII